MGSGQSSVRSAEFRRPEEESPDPTEFEPVEHHINISNKMVERLVEDAALAGAAASVPVATPGDYMDRIFTEKLKRLDEHHSERFGLTARDITATAARIEMRTAKMPSVEPICAHCKRDVIQCYSDNTGNTVKCKDVVDAFTKCVSEAGASRLRARREREAREHARRTRRVALARETTLKDLGNANC